MQNADKTLGHKKSTCLDAMWKIKFINLILVLGDPERICMNQRKTTQRWLINDLTNNSYPNPDHADLFLRHGCQDVRLRKKNLLYLKF